MKQHKLCRLEKEIQGVKMVVTRQRARRTMKEGGRDRGGQRAVGGTKALKLFFQKEN